MIGDSGPYVELDGPRVWVPRTVPYIEARRLAREVAEPWQRLAYRGKVDALLLGFVRDCRCEEVCERRFREDEVLGDPVDTGDRACYVPAWAFEVIEP